jgi:hypothetical protein
MRGVVVELGPTGTHGFVRQRNGLGVLYGPKMFSHRGRCGAPIAGR